MIFLRSSAYFLQIFYKAIILFNELFDTNLHVCFGVYPLSDLVEINVTFVHIHEEHLIYWAESFINSGR